MKKLVWLSVLLFSFISCHRQDIKEILWEAEELSDRNPDSVLLILEQIDYPQKLRPNEKALFGFLKARADVMLGKSMASDSLILYTLDYYKENNDSIRLLKSYIPAFHFYKWKGDTLHMLRIWNKGLSLAVDLEDSISISSFYDIMAYCRFNLGRDNPESVGYFKKSLNYQDKSKTYYMLGLCYDTIDNDSLYNYLEKGIKVALQQEKDTLIACHYLRNYAGIMVKRNKRDKAMELIRHTYRLSPYYKNVFANDLIIAEIFIRENNMDSAMFYLDKGEQDNLNMSFGKSSQENFTLKNLSALYRSIVNYTRNRTLDVLPIVRYNDSIYVDIREQYKRLREKDEIRNQLERQNLLLAIDRQRIFFGSLACIVLLILIIGAICLSIRNHHYKLAEAEERVEVLTRLLDDAVKTNPGKGPDGNLFKKILLQQLGIIRLVAVSPSVHNRELLRRMAEITDKELPVESLLVWDDLYSVIDSAYNGFYSGMVNLYKDILNEKEIQLCCLLCAGFSTKEISVVAQQSVPTVYQRKTTIRRKLGMDEKEDIVIFIASKIYM
ncbi:hypothetical protein OCV73_06885 [Barnesiella propionica]|uniref:helix-turn-helix transcriptional regulator n=1 Tax=Barnesiella propionica TaxID=2981781 RepID=UPI0011C7305F|nr:hypothetical protein [Barnesiella propionica]MCU6768672.1 hypothetical protein [Barnesiella propionica]